MPCKATWCAVIAEKMLSLLPSSTRSRATKLSSPSVNWTTEELLVTFSTSMRLPTSSVADLDVSPDVWSDFPRSVLLSFVRHLVNFAGPVACFQAAFSLRTSFFSASVENLLSLSQWCPSWEAQGPYEQWGWSFVFFWCYFFFGFILWDEEDRLLVFSSHNWDDLCSFVSRLQPLSTSWKASHSLTA